jgi:putative salt-induced outer membrane protein
MNKIISALATSFLVSSQAFAEEPAAVETAAPVEKSVAPAKEKEAESLWKASAELGFVSTSGNTDTETLNAKAMASTEREEWRHKIEVTALNSSDANTTTAEKYTMTAQSDYKLEKPNYLFANIAYENDKFSGYQYRVSEAIGYGRSVIDETDLTLNLEIGPGARQSKLDNGTTESEAILFAAAKLDWTISDTSKFTEVLTVEGGEDVTVTKSVTGLSSQINGSLSMKFTYTYKKTSEVPVGVDDTDTETAITLVYNF